MVSMRTEDVSILLVDDEQLVLEMFQDMLTADGYQVTAVSNAADALDLLSKKTFNIMISDVRLKPLDGFQIMEKAQDQNPGMPVILMTGAPVQGDKEKLSGRNTCYLLKPISVQVMSDVVSSMVNESERAKILPGKMTSAPSRRRVA